MGSTILGRKVDSLRDVAADSFVGRNSGTPGKAGSISVADALTMLGIEAVAAYTLEQLQDAIAAMLQGGTHTNLTVTYDDAAGTINLSALGGGGLDQEQAEDIVAALVGVTGGGINVAYDDAAGTLTFSLSGESYTTAEKNKLADIATEATANATDADLRDRTTHTGTQAISTVTGLQTALDGKATSAQGATADSALQPADITSGSITAGTGDIDFDNLGGGGLANAEDITDGVRVSDGGLGPSSFEVSKAETSATNFERLKVAAGTAVYQVGSAVGSAGGFNRDVQFGHWDSAGTFTEVLTVDSDRVWLNGTAEGATVRAFERGGSFRNPIAFGIPYNGGDPVEGIEFCRLQEGGTPPAIRFPGSDGRLLGCSQIDLGSAGVVQLGNAAYGLSRASTITRVSGFSGVDITTSTASSTLAPLRASGVETGVVWCASTAIDDVPMSAEAAAGQTANLIEVNSNGGTGGDLFRCDSSGAVVVAGNIETDGQLKCSSGALSGVDGLRIGTADLFADSGAWRFYKNGSTRFSILDAGPVVPDGRFLLFSSASTPTAFTTQDVGLQRDQAGVLKVTAGDTGTGGLVAGQLSAIATAIDVVPISAEAAAGQTANLMEIKYNGGTEVVTVSSSGHVIFGDSSNDPHFHSWVDGTFSRIDLRRPGVGARGRISANNSELSIGHENGTGTYLTLKGTSGASISGVDRFSGEENSSLQLTFEIIADYNTVRIRDGSHLELRGGQGRGTDSAGGELRLKGGLGSGTGTPGPVSVEIGQKVASGSTLQTVFDEVARFDDSDTAGETRFMLWDNDTGALARVSVGADDSAGTGFKALRIPN